jgi:predicted phage tail protein
MRSSRFIGSGQAFFRKSFLSIFRLFPLFAGSLLLLTTSGAHAVPTLSGASVQSVYIVAGYFYVSWSGGDIGALLESQTAPYVQTAATNKVVYSPPLGSTVYTVTGKAAGVYYYNGLYGAGGGLAVTNDVTVILYRNLPVISTWSPAYAGNALPLSWTTSPPATGYILEQQYNGGAWTQAYSGAGNSFTTGALAAGSYNFRVRPVYASFQAGFTSAAVSVNVIAPPLLTGGSFQSVYVGYPTNGTLSVNWAGDDLGALLESKSAPFVQAGATEKFSYAAAPGARSLTLAGKAPGIYYYTGFVGICNNCALTNDITVAVYGSVPIVTAPATNNTGGFNLSWTTVSPANSYRLESQFNGGAWTTVYSGAASSYAVSGLASGTYSFRAYACVSANCASFTAAPASTVVLPAAPALTVPSTSNSGTFSLTWNPVATATSYQVEQSINYGAWTTIFNSSGTGTNVFGLGNGFYQYRVRACNANGCSLNSPIQSTSVLWPPSPPQTLTLPLSSNSGGVTATWSSSATATSYQLEQRLNGGAWGIAYSGTATTAVLTGLVAGIYDYQVRACNSGGCSGPGTVATSYVGAVPAVPSPITGPATNGGAFTLAWGATAGTNNYGKARQRYLGNHLQR